MDPLNAEDAALLYAEAPGTQLQIGALCFFEAAPLRDRRGRLRDGELRSYFSGRLDALPRFRQRIAPVFADAAAPMWVDDTDFDIERHCRLVELPAHDGADALRGFMDSLLSEPMDLAHPLWDIHMVEAPDTLARGGGADIDTVAVVVRAHHVMADGIALHAAATLLLDPVPRPPSSRSHDWLPEPTPGTFDLAARALAERARRQTGLAFDVARVLIDPRQTASNIRLASRVVGPIRHGLAAPAPTLPFTGPVGQRRAFAWDSVPMPDIVAVKQACGATVNDVVLAIVAGALRRHLEADGSFDPDAGEPRALIPIGSPESSASSLRNRFSITTVALPVGVEDPLERVRLIHSRMHGRTTSPVQSIMPNLFSIADLIPPPVLRGLVPRLLARQPLVNLAVSNIPGSRVPLFLWEARMLGLHPFINVVGNVALIIGVLSYVDDLGVGITVDPDVVGDPEAIITHLRAAATEM
ncbi:MAG: wax ester/triacylglycerol synthase family O-acyltransferase, partial [Acidimicrobiia bacterium]|nr:wax ester/triacylglycerol synthase family O-acyltransferase [Acidimicrobiia bacterium]